MFLRPLWIFLEVLHDVLILRPASIFKGRRLGGEVLRRDAAPLADGDLDAAVIRRAVGLLLYLAGDLHCRAVVTASRDGAIHRRAILAVDFGGALSLLRRRDLGIVLPRVDIVGAGALLDGLLGAVGGEADVADAPHLRTRRRGHGVLLGDAAIEPRRRGEGNDGAIVDIGKDIVNQSALFSLKAAPRVEVHGPAAVDAGAFSDVHGILALECRIQMRHRRTADAGLIVRHGREVKAHIFVRRQRDVTAAPAVFGKVGGELSALDPHTVLIGGLDVRKCRGRTNDRAAAGEPVIRRQSSCGHRQCADLPLGAEVGVRQADFAGISAILG